MKLFSFLTLVTASISAASPIVSRQTYGTVWNDRIIPEPINFRIFETDDQCSFQLVYERFSVDSRYSVQYFAEYADGSQ